MTAQFKLITECTNCKTTFESNKTYDLRDMDGQQIRTHGHHECVGGYIGMKVFKAFKEVKS